MSWTDPEDQVRKSLARANRRLEAALDPTGESWRAENATEITKRAAERLGVDAGVFNGQMDVWTEMFEVVEWERELARVQTRQEVR